MADTREFQVKNSAVFGLVLESSTAFTTVPVSRGGKDRFWTLLELCAAAIAKYQSLMQIAMDIVPRVLICKLLKEALLRSHHLCIRDLISSWPGRSLDFSQILGPQNRRHLLDLLNWESGRAKMIIHSLLNCQSEALQVVDLREALPNREATVTFVEASLQSHRQQRTKDLHVYLNMWIEGRLKEEGRILKALSAHGKGMKLHPCRVVTVFLGSSLEKLQRRLDAQVLTGLELKSEMLESADAFLTLLGGGKFPNLSALSLPNFARRLESGGFQTLGEVLSCLPALQRLNLNGLRVTGQLRRVLRDVSPLQQLNVSNCRLSPPDVVFLSNSHHVKTLRELSISGMTNFDATCLLLRKVAPQLTWLDLSGCPKCFEEDFSALMTRLLLQCCFSRLRTLDCRGNLHSAEHPTLSVLEVFRACDKMSTLKTLYLDCLYLNDSGEEQASALLDTMKSKNRTINVQMQHDQDTYKTFFKICWADTAR
ncbi:leucine-rich repeat-containing protein 14-like [Branchiostoma lanceolatum]|uniref:leucine-rich repeat-containing protein 14-like n=1 Tax=Branchiostoma lanceolatum TaxID=7740 RepID=UPI0034516EE5